MAVDGALRYPTEMRDGDDERPPRYGRWGWPRVPRTDHDVVVRQLHEAGCGAAYGVMLLRDRGRFVSLETFADGLMMPSEPSDLASRLQAWSPDGPRWLGGSLPPAVTATWDLVAELCHTRGTWAALLEPHGHLRPGHWVVVDEITDEGLVLVRDPDGAAYGMPLRDFAVLWGYTVLVIEEVER